MGNDKKLTDAEDKLVAALEQASDGAMNCINREAHKNTRWQLLQAAMILRDRMRSIVGGTLLITPKAVAVCTTEVVQVSAAAKDAGDGPHYDRVVVEGNQAIAVIDASGIQAATA
ncbi:hypothetical protein [Lysobacter enzymogenes]|uniref:hypothetical protein n=1 Tax=Lysobacter enzymogenes TaxID=69 RepID=UPI00099B30BA|nr:hypothetical protein [Lysobacter enzymogenes]UZW63186.1 hypothetical protein BV903_013250 [Lysobacter enzymogenes]